MELVDQLKKFMEPESVAIYGVSRRTGDDAFNILENLLSYPYRGRIYPINPNAGEILGVKTYPGIKAIKESIDLAIINLPRHLVPGAVRECLEQGIRAAIVVSQGFADAADTEGKRLQQALDALVKQGIRILGPNTFGTANPYINFSSCFRRMNMEKMPVGLICQSGVFFAGSAELRLLGKGIDLGNSCDINISDALEYFAQDQTKVVAMHIEGVRDGRRFLRIARRVSQQKPLVAYKTGRSDIAVRAVQSHTGSLVGRDEVWEAAFKQAGVIRVNDVDELGDMVKAFTVLPLMQGRKVGIATNSGGMGIIIIDACRQFNLEVARLSSETLEQINAVCPPWLGTGNPADLWPAVMVAKNSMTEVLRRSLDAMLQDVDGLILVWAPWSEQTLNDTYEILTGLSEKYPAKPIISCPRGILVNEIKSRLESTHIMVCHNPTRAMRVFDGLARYSAYRRGL